MADPIQIVTYQVPPIGSVWDEEERGQLSLVVEREGASTPYRRTSVVRKQVEILGVSPRIATVARITYLEHTTRVRSGDAERTRPSPIAGKRYVLDATGGEVVISRDSGDPVSDEEAAAIRKEEKRFGRKDSLPILLDRLRFRPGEAVPVPPATASQLFGGELEVAKLELTFVERRDDDAYFTLVVVSRGDRDGTATRMEAAGTLRVDPATAQLRELRVTGPVHSTGGMTAEGVIEITAVRTAGKNLRASP